MTEQGEARRAYRSPLRDRQAGETRRAVVAAATDLFVRQGYAATTVDAVAEAAGVSRRTVFNVVGGKAALVKLAWDWSLVGDDEPVPMAERPMVRRIQASTDQVESVRLWAETQVEVAARAAPIARVLTAAADTDADVAALLERIDTERMLGARAFVEHLAGLGGLRPGMTVGRAADLIWSLNDGALYSRLVLERGWSAQDYTELINRTTTAALLPG